MVAVSGGGDSLALLALALETGRPVLAAIIDHGLRPTSADDAAFAADIAQTLGAQVQIRRLTGLKPTQRHARAARYAALCDIARSAGASALWLGHTQDDQAETVLMRAARGAGPRGLAAMAGLAWCGVWPEGRGVALARPLLTVSRQDLRTLLRARGLTWLEDPANVDPRYLRSRARAALAADQPARARLAAIAARLSPLVEAEAAMAWAAAARIATTTADGLCQVDARGLATLPIGPRLRLWAALLAAASGAPRPPVAAAVALLDKAALTPGFRGATLGGASIARNQNHLQIARDPGAALGHSGRPPLPAMALARSETVVYDARFEITAATEGLFVRLCDQPPTPGAPKVTDAAGRPAAAQVQALADQRLRELLTRPQTHETSVTGV